MKCLTTGRGAAALFLLIATFFPTPAQAITLPIVSRSILKEFFQRGDKPTAQQFGTLIDSMVSYTDDRYLIGLKVYDPLTPYLPGDTVAAKRFGIGISSPDSPLGYLDPHTYNIQLAPDFAGQWGLLPVLLGNSTGNTFYGYLQLYMDALPPAPLGGPAAVVEPPAIHVEYIVYNDTPGQPFTMFAAPEPASASLLVFAAALLRRRRR